MPTAASGSDARRSRRARRRGAPAAAAGTRSRETGGCLTRDSRDTEKSRWCRTPHCRWSVHPRACRTAASTCAAGTRPFLRVIRRVIRDSVRYRPEVRMLRMIPRSRMLPAVGLAFAMSSVLSGQTTPDTTEAHCARAKAIAATDFINLYNRFADVCGGTATPEGAPQGRRGGGPPPPSVWHHEPVKVFDNVYFLGTKEHSSWAVQTSEGLIVIDALFDYAVKDEVVEGLRKLGVNPATMKYLIISHGHADHHGG